MTLVESVRHLTKRMWYESNTEEEALAFLNEIDNTMGITPITLGFRFMWPTEIYEAYQDALGIYLLTVMRTNASKSN